MRTVGRVDRDVKLARARVVDRAGRLWRRHRPSFEQLGGLTPIAASPGQPTYLFGTSDQVISRALFEHSEYEEDELRWVLDYLGHPQRGRTVVDVGANIGTTSIPLLVRYGAAGVEAFEPDEMNFDLLRCNLILNRVEAKATTRRLAVSDTSGEVTFELSSWNFGDHRVRVSGAAAGIHGEANRPTVVVPSVRLDDVVTAAPEEIGLIWVDAQGHEAHILEGGERLLDHGIPWVIEYWPYGLTLQGGLDRLNKALAHRFSHVVDIRRSMSEGRTVLLETAGLGLVAAELGTDYTDFILIPDALVRLR